jgi:EAL domain-containing protein (putative c-di-GMP-specific phosphodiesterase class I)/GGDEF domain-containing protein|tara:strand:- start:22314 stop:23597 length:1284 start_codon:yes stop_codon:yes gene_type:complete
MNVIDITCEPENLNVPEFRKLVNLSITNNKAGTLALIDLIDFKNINYHLGTETADQTLLFIGEELAKNLTLRYGTFSAVCHYTSDLFLFYIASNVTQEESVDLFLNVNSVITKPNTMMPENVKLDFRMTMTSYNNIANNFDIMVEGCEYLMRLAKSKDERFIPTGNNIPQAFLSRAAFTEEFNASLLNKDFRFVLQPKHDIDNGSVIGAEALCRWYDKDGNLYPLPVVLDLIFQYGLADTFAKHTVDFAFEILREIKISGHPLITISINMDVHQLSSKSVYEHFVLRAEENRQFVPYLEIELTEDNLFSNQIDCIRYLKRLRNQGYGLSVDDFGRGYSNLQSLIDLKPDVIKIDKSLIDNIINCDSSVKVLTAIIAMGISTKGIIAEGVELDEQISVLKKLGIKHVQGHFFNPPVQRHDFFDILKLR